MTGSSSTLLHMRLPEASAVAPKPQPSPERQEPQLGQAANPAAPKPGNEPAPKIELYFASKRLKAFALKSLDLKLAAGKQGKGIHHFTFGKASPLAAGKSLYKLMLPGQKLSTHAPSLQVVETVSEPLYKLDLGLDASLAGQQGCDPVQIVSTAAPPRRGRRPLELILNSWAKKSGKHALSLENIDLFVGGNDVVAADIVPLLTPAEESASKSVAAKSALRIGIWDLGAMLGKLPPLLDAFNAAQSRYAFFNVEATVPVGMIRARQGVVAWIKEKTQKRLSPTDRKEIANNMIANDFFALGETVRKDISLDYLVGVTPSMIAGEDAEEIYWNHFSTFEAKCILASTHDLRSFAAQTKRPFTIFLGGIIVAQLLAAQFFSRGLGFHEETRDCLFDYNRDRSTIMDKIDELRIEPGCLSHIAPAYRHAALSLVELLKTYK